MKGIIERRSIMGFDEVKKKYRNQWVLIEFSKLDKDLRVRDGKVIAHAHTKEDIYKALLETRGKNVSIEYCGEMPEDLVVMVCLGRMRPREKYQARGLHELQSRVW